MKIEHECSELEAHLVREINFAYVPFCKAEGLPQPPADNPFFAVLVCARQWFWAQGERGRPMDDKLN